ncbi:outer membrane protein assembly factor BamE domain-containing protein [Undibacterium sp. WLX3042]|uniref:outer membrane protein assembly factor BamE domain-containing protein n=1 Tax=Undibacterium sp. WLX3042 TaxID=3412686 RepID=UPI003C2E8106
MKTLKMNTMIRLAAISLVAVLSSCASWRSVDVAALQTESEVTTRLGNPTDVYQDGATHLLEYMHGRRAQATHMVRVAADGKVISYEQVLTEQKFAEIKLGVSDKAAVLKILGAPYEHVYYSRVGLEAWSYPYKESGVWNSLMAVYFDQDGIVRKLENGPDPVFEPREHRRF